MSTGNMSAETNEAKEVSEILSSNKEENQEEMSVKTDEVIEALETLNIREEENQDEEIWDSQDNEEPFESQNSKYQDLNCCLETPETEDSEVVIAPPTFVKDVVTKARSDFEEFSIVKIAPLFIPTIFVNHQKRKDFVDKRRKTCLIRLPANCADAYQLFCMVYEDIRRSFKRKFFLNHSRLCERVCLKAEYSPECAFEEMLMLRPYFYSKNTDVKKQSRYVNLNEEWNPRYDENCCVEVVKSGSFVVEFCAIYPEIKVSTVIVACPKCGRLSETVLDEYIALMVKKELLEFSKHFDIKSDEPHTFRAVLSLPRKTVPDTQHIVPKFASAEGLVGFTPLTSSTLSQPSVFVRLQIRYDTNPNCDITGKIHESQEEEDTFPDYVEKYLL